MVLFSNLPRVRGDQPIEYASLTEETFTPHARGSTRLCRRRKRPPKILPACAGINPIRYASGSQSIDLPRMRGDQPQPIVAYTTFKDLPRVCGDQPGYTFVLDYWCEFPPRARGSTLVIALSADVVYIYPACAGISLGKAQLLSRYFNLPRRRGDHPFVPKRRKIANNLPRMRGDQPQPIVAYTTFKDLPRVCGDQPGYTFVLDYWCEFPPRARGSTLVIALSADVVYIYPACAGISLGKAQLLSRYFNLPRRRGDHPFVPKRRKIANNLPRMRGGQPRVTVMVASFSEFTPHARGSTWGMPMRADRNSIYPACAGVNLGYVDESGPRQYLPRMRGDQP